MAEGTLSNDEPHAGKIDSPPRATKEEKEEEDIKGMLQIQDAEMEDNNMYELDMTSYWLHHNFTTETQLRKILLDRETRVEFLEREMQGLRQEIAESEIKVRELERKIGVSKVKKIEERSKMIRLEEEMKGKVCEKEREILGLKKKIEELEEELRKWRERARNMEVDVSWLKEEVIELMKENEGRVMHGVDSDSDHVHVPVPVDAKVKPIVAAGGAIVAVTAFIYMCFRKRR